VLTAAALYWDISLDAQLKAMNILTNFYEFSGYFILGFIPLIESAFALDLVLLLRNPFADSSARTPKWLVSTTLTAFALAVVTKYFIDDHVAIKHYFSQITRYFFVCVYVPVIIYVLYRLRQPGLSEKFRKDFLTRQIFYCGVMCLM